MEYSNAESFPTFKRQVEHDDRMTNVKLINDPEQLRLRKERDLKEADRLLHFKLQFSITPIKIWKLLPEKYTDPEELGYASILFQEFDFKKNEYVNVGTSTEARVMIKGKKNIKLHGDIKFQKAVGLVFEMGAAQQMRVVLLAKSNEEEDDESATNIAHYDFRISDLLNTEARAIRKELIFSKTLKRRPKHNKYITIRLDTPAPKPHCLARDTSYEGTHIVLRDMNKFGEVEAKQLSVTMKIMVRDLPIMNRLTKNTNSYFQVFKDGVKFKQKLYQSEILSDKISGNFNTFSFGIEGERSLDKPMLIEVWHRNTLMKSEFIGIMRTDLYDLRSGKVDFQLVNPDVPTEYRGTVKVLKYEERIWITEKVIQKCLNKKTGVIKTVENVIYKNDFSIMNYLGHYPVCMSFAVDFTASNGVKPVSNANSFHYLSGDQLNPYQKSLIGLRNSLKPWSNQTEMKMYGFGGVKNSIFEMKASKLYDKPVGHTVTQAHMLKMYKKFAKSVDMGFDNEFVRIITDVAKISERVLSYHVLVVILDGDKFDYKRTCDVIKRTQRCGMSILFVGIGGEPFKNLLRLQQDCRNVTFTRYVDNEQQVSRNAMYKLPVHMLEFFAIHKIVPENY
ncbi:hypothetical protein AKO1_011703 [Acrasis kona]|uniref:Copine C-terminal domain-containing protein n=1 Tax=Acrasis kona TaxID=1008807 RepID=A0AAW2Z657_9EUKA